MARLPPGIFPGSTPGEAAALVQTLPHPSGVLRLDVAAAPGRGLGAARFAVFALNSAPRTPEELWAALEGVTVTLDWAPLPPLE